ncbi:MAG TPA: DUF1080 domain-containing protein [Isosphaeraceae bacterium]|nr:DUF1080 domain-containing protein [Isosphaeraceae bacterium]
MRNMGMILGLFVAVSVASADDKAEPNDKTLGAKPPEGAVVLFDGGDLDGWVKNQKGDPAEWPVMGEIFTVGAGKGSIWSKEKFGDCQIHVEFAVPYMPDAKGQARGNSGVYVNGIYEVQVLDSYGLDSKDNDCGGIYKQYAPAVNACKPPLQWQTYDITFTQAKGDEKGRITVVQNGITIIDDKPIEPTPGGVGFVKAGEDGPIMLQDHGNAVQYRNIWVKKGK